MSRAGMAVSRTWATDRVQEKKLCCRKTNVADNHKVWQPCLSHFSAKKRKAKGGKNLFRQNGKLIKKEAELMLSFLSE